MKSEYKSYVLLRPNAVGITMPAAVAPDGPVPISLPDGSLRGGLVTPLLMVSD